MGQVVGGELLGAEALDAPVVHGGGEIPIANVDGQHRAALRGHDLPSCAGGEGDDAVAGPVRRIPDHQLGTGQLPELVPCRASPAVQLGHVGPAPGVHGGRRTLSDIGRPSGDDRVQRRVPIGRHGDATGAGVPDHGRLHVA
jgi:hypothetical protein